MKNVIERNDCVSLRMSLFVLFLLARSFVHFSFACPKEKPNQRERTPPDIHIPIRPPSRRVCGTRFAQTVLDFFRLSWRPSLTGCSLNGGTRPPPSLPQGRKRPSPDPSTREGRLSSRQSGATRVLKKYKWNEKDSFSFWSSE